MDFKDKGLEAWEDNAVFWDDYMGDESNFFHRDMVRPDVEKFLELTSDDYVLDIACGNGNFSSYMAKQGVRVTGFDYSPKMIELAKKRRSDVLDKVNFRVCDATNKEELLKLQIPQGYTKAVSNMAIMDISEIKPLFEAVSDMLQEGGSFVFAMHHPCFTYPNEDYLTSCINKGVAVEGQPSLQNYYHRTLSEVLNLGFSTGFVMDKFEEIPFKGESTPIIMVIRLRKI